MSNNAPQQPADYNQATTPLPPYTQPQQPYGAQQVPVQQSYSGAQAPGSAAQAPATTLGATNTFAVLSIILAFISPLAAIIFGHLGLSQIKRNGDAGRGIALTGTIIGYAYFVMIALFFIFYIGMIVVMFGAMGAAFSGMDPYYDDSYTY